MPAPRIAEAAILAALEELLVDHDFSALSTSAICRRAGVSRQAFYLHFADKRAVLVSAVQRLIDDVFVVIDPFLSHAPDEDVDETLRSSLIAWVTTCLEHRVLLRTVIEEWPRDPDLLEVWTAVLARSTQDVATGIERDHKAGSAPSGVDPTALAAVLMWGFERVLHVALVDDDDGTLEDPYGVVDPLLHLLIGAVYARPAAAAPPTRRP